MTCPSPCVVGNIARFGGVLAAEAFDNGATMIAARTDAFTVDGRCGNCLATVSFMCSKEGFRAWRKGVHIKNALPELTDAEREYLISGLCEECLDLLREVE